MPDFYVGAAKTEALHNALLGLMRELTDAPYDPREAFASWQRCTEALHNVGQHDMCDH